MTTHTVPAKVFDLLARGDGGTLGVLRAGQRSKRLLLIHELASMARSRAPGIFSEGCTAEAYKVLIDAQHHSPHTVDELLLHPHVGAWAAHCLRCLMSERGISSADLGHLGAIAASAALRASRAFEVSMFIHDGSVMFPTFGLARLGTHNGWCRVKSRSDTRGVEILTAGTTTTVPFETSTGLGSPWIPLRRLSSRAGGVEVSICLDDLGPYRGCDQLRVTARLDKTTFEDWQAKLDEAWSLLVREHRVRAEAIAAGVTSIVPLLPSEAAPELSATCHEAVGAVAMTPPMSSLTLVLALVHEFQHTKLSALLDLVPLVDRSPQNLFYAPWRSDPRPLRGLLQGAYAYLGLTEFWNVHRGSAGPRDPTNDDQAHFEFAMSRDQVTEALGSLQVSGLLTRPGRRFVEGMKRQLSQFHSLPVPPAPRSLARVACIDHATSWRLRNVRPNPEQVEGWVDAWLTGRACPRLSHTEATTVDGHGPMPSNARVALLRHQLAFPGVEQEHPGGASQADVLYCAGRLTEAADAYRRQLDRRPDDLASWAGLSLVRRSLPTRATPALTKCPEIVYSLHEAVRTRTGTAPDAEELAGWVAHDARVRER
jgi:HEXXH motif-containing protein